MIAVCCFYVFISADSFPDRFFGTPGRYETGGNAFHSGAHTIAVIPPDEQHLALSVYELDFIWKWVRRAHQSICVELGLYRDGGNKKQTNQPGYMTGERLDVGLRRMTGQMTTRLICPLLAHRCMR
jgi:hypothetical protein